MTRWLRLVVAVAMLKNVAAIGVAVASGVRMAPPLVYSPDQYALLILAFSATGIVLIAAHTRDERAVWLGCILLLTAAPFAETLLGVSASLNPSLASIARLLERTPVVPLLAVFCWLFVRHFPDDISSGIGKRVSHAGIRTSLAMALLLVASNLSESVWPISLDASPDFRARISRQSHQSFYWPIIIAAALPAFAFLAWRTQSAGLAERRRVRIFVAGLLMGFVPISLTVLLEAVSPAYGRLVTGSDAGYWIAQIVFLSLAAVPLVTAYSVMVDRVVEIRLVIRSALQYALAKYTLLAIVTVPLAGMIWYLYRYRDRTLLQILSGSGLLLLGITALIAGVLLLTRTRALRALDRRFFREQYDARHILNDLADRCRKAPTVDDLVALVCRDVDRALHLDYVTVLLATPGGGVLRSPDGRIPPLSESSGLAVLAKGDRTPLLVDLKNDPTLRRLPDEERNWLVESGFGLLVPLNAADGSLQGLVGLGHKLSELPFSREDRLLLEAIGASVALTIENRRLRDSASSQKQGRLSTLPPERRPDDGRPATECDACGRVYPADATVCDCGSELEPSLVPYMLSGKFQLDRRLGRGGMGVVYRALDLDLGRHVAIKTLPHMGPDEAARLRREAKAMAAVQHENLAMIFGAETWFGMPILVVELLAGGTLAARLRSGPVPFAQALEIGIALSRGVEHLHHAGVLHCDIKPSNIGFTRHDVPKLLDFGLATIRRPATGNTTTRSSSGFDRSAGVTPVGAADGVPFEGTPRYMSPEALAGQPPQRASDIWSLTVVLFEMMAGTPPFGGASFAAIGGAVLQGAPPDIRAACPTCPPAIASFFARALSRSGERPRTAVHLGVELVRLRDDLTMQ